MRRLPVLSRSSRSFIFACLALSSSLLVPSVEAARRNLEEILVVVNNDVITNEDFAQYKKITLRQLGNNKIPLPPEAQLNAQILDRLINERIQLQVAEQSGIQVEELQLNRSLQRIAEDSHMTVAQLMTGLERTGITVARFREEIRHEILLNRLQEREIGARVTVSEADIDRYWEQQAQAPTSQNTPVSAVPQYHARHILIKVNEAMPDDEAQQKIKGLYRQLQAQPDQFATLAERHSEDGTARKGGDLGWLSLGDTVPEFEHAMVALKPNQLSGPVRSPFGYHLIQLLATRQYDAQKNKDRTIARNALRAQKMQETFADWLQQLRARATIEYRAAKPPAG